MLQKTLITVGASLTAVVLLLFMIQRKKSCRPAPGKSIESIKDVGRANNNEDAGTSKDDPNPGSKSDNSGKITEAVTVTPNGVVVKTVGNSKVEEGSTEQASKKVSVDALIKPLVQELCKIPAVELTYQETFCENASLQQSLVQHEPSETLVSEPSCTVQNTYDSEQVRNFSVLEHITANKQGHGLPAVQAIVAASKPVDKCPIQQQKQGITASEPVDQCPMHQQEQGITASEPVDECPMHQQEQGITTSEPADECPMQQQKLGITANEPVDECPMHLQEPGITTSEPVDECPMQQQKLGITASEPVDQCPMHQQEQGITISEPVDECPMQQQKQGITASEPVDECPMQQLKQGIAASEPVVEGPMQQQKQGFTASEPVNEFPMQQQKQAIENSEEQQSLHLNTQVDGCDLSNSSFILEVPVSTSIEESSPDDNTMLSETISDQHIHNQSTDLTESPGEEQKCADTEQENDDTDKQDVKLDPKEIIENRKSSIKEPIVMAGEQSSVTDNPCITNSHNLPPQTSSEESNGRLVQEPSQIKSIQSNEDSIVEKSQNSESEQSNCEPLQDFSQLESEQSNAEMVEKSSCSKSRQSNGGTVEKASHSKGQDNGESNKKSTDTVEHPNGGSIETASSVEHFYDNHKIVLSGKPSNLYKQGDYRKLWPQPHDGLIFVKSSAGQPLVPQHLRDTDYLTNRPIPIHDPATTAFLYSNMHKLVYPPENWVRVISVSENLEMRVRHDERDMLLEQLERKGICDPTSKPPAPRLLTVGSLVAAHLDVPRRGLIWCRAHITAVLPVTGPSGRRKGRQPQPQPLFMVESIDHFPAASAEPVRASDLRPLAAHALQAPFYDQLFCLLNTMPTDAVEFSSSARDLLLEQLRAGHNFLRVTGPAASTYISGTCHWMASLAAVQTRDTGGAVCLLEEELQKSEHAMPIYSGRVLDGLPFDKCIFRDGEAFWSDDDRYPSSLKPSCGPPNPLQEYLWLRRTDPRIIQAFRGFKLPYKHAKHQFKVMGFSMSLHEYYTVYRHHSSTVLLTADPDKVLKVVLDDPQALVILDFHMQTLIRFYHFDPKLIDDPEAHVAKDNTPMHMLSFPKDENGFLILGNTFFSDFTKDNLRIPIMPF